MGYFNDLTLSYTAEDARLDRLDGYTVTTFTTRIDPMIAEAAKYRETTYSIYYSTGRQNVWRKRHAGSFPSYKLAEKALKRLGWQRGNGVYHCIIPATATVLTQAIGLELLYGRH
jgi:hypothetical protein